VEVACFLECTMSADRNSKASNFVRDEDGDRAVTKVIVRLKDLSQGAVWLRHGNGYHSPMQLQNLEDPSSHDRPVLILVVYLRPAQLYLCRSGFDHRGDSFD
jgi:hypothetical protein